ncbi:MAG: hypothetical protein WEC15_04425, partial [Flavobacteriales bacterium]
GGCLSASAQEGFIVHYNEVQAGKNGTGGSVREVDGGYLLFCRQLSQQFPADQHVYVRRLGLTGTLLNEHEYLMGEQRDFSFGSIDPVTDELGGYIVSSVVEGYDYSGTTSLYKFDLLGDTLSRKFLVGWPASDSVTHGIRQTRRTNDGGYVLGGFWHRPGDAQAYVIRLNADGDTLWTKQIGLLSQDEDIMGLSEYTDGGFVLTGYRQYGGSFERSILIRTDANGNPLWTRYYGGFAGQNGSVKVTADGGIVTWSDYREQGWPPNYSQVMLTKWNAVGEIVWQRKSHYGYYSGARDIEVLSDGSFIGTAFSAAAGLNGMLCKFSSEGDSLWTRGYQVASGPHYLNDVTLTSDGGFVCTGEANRMMPQDAANFQQSQTIYVFKTDSMGCVVPGCHTVGVQEYALDLNQYLRIWPNPLPAGQALQFTFAPPTTFTPNGSLRVVLLDAMGRQVHEQHLGHLGHSERSEGVPMAVTASLATGLYYLHLTDGNRWLAGGKVVVSAP